MWKGGFEVREHGEETEIMRDLGKEDVRAYRSEKGKELVMEKGGSRGLKEGKSI